VAEPAEGQNEGRKEEQSGDASPRSAATAASNRRGCE